MTTALFSGQGSQYQGMGKSLVEADSSLEKIYEAGSDILGWDLKRMCLEAPAEELGETVHSQPAIMATSIIALEAAKKKGFEFEAVAGHSLGEYAAMYASDVLSLEDAFKIIKLRAEAMDKAAKSSDGSMAAILKIAPEKVEEVCAEIEGYVIPVNYNSPVQTVIAGEKEAVAKACEKFAELKARAVPLAVASAFHSKIMQPAADEFASKVNELGITFNKPSVKFYSNVLGTELTEMEKAGFTKFVEFGPGKVLTGLVKKTLKGVEAFNVESVETLEVAL